MLSVETRACAQIRSSSRKVVHAPPYQALSNLENASTRSGVSNLRGCWSLVAGWFQVASIMLHKRNSRQVQHDRQNDEQHFSHEYGSRGRRRGSRHKSAASHHWGWCGGSVCCADREGGWGRDCRRGTRGNAFWFDRVVSGSNSRRGDSISACQGHS